MAVHLSLPHDALVDFCRRWNISELAFFGSVLRDDFQTDSDVDVVVDFAPGMTPGLAAVDMHDELEAILGRKVDLLTRTGVEYSRNSLMRDEILRSLEVYYAA